MALTHSAPLPGNKFYGRGGTATDKARPEAEADAGSIGGRDTVSRMGACNKTLFCAQYCIMQLLGEQLESG